MAATSIYDTRPSQRTLTLPEQYGRNMAHEYFDRGEDHDSARFFVRMGAAHTFEDVEYTAHALNSFDATWATLVD